METAEGVVAASALKIGNQLVGFYHPKVSPSLVKEATSKVLPYYAVPSSFHALDEFPLTSNG